MPTPLLDNLRRTGKLYRIAGPTGQPYSDEPSETAAQMTWDLLPQAIGVDATNVTDWMSQQGPDAIMDEVLEQPGLMPPWDTAWIEWDWSRENLLIDSWPVKRGGCLIWSGLNVTHELMEEAVRRWPGERIREWYAQPHRMIVLGPYLPWQGGVIGPWGYWSVAMDERGTPVMYEEEHLEVFGLGQRIMQERSRDTGQVADGVLPIKMATYIALRTFQFANCSNVDLVEVTPHLSRQQRRWHERTGEPINTWHELQIGSMGGRRYEPGERKAVQGLVRQHICRGHFATYTDEGKLFGKYTGRFWIPATVKGNPERGRADKGYVVEATA